MHTCNTKNIGTHTIRMQIYMQGIHHNIHSHTIASRKHGIIKWVLKASLLRCQIYQNEVKSLWLIGGSSA